MDLIISIGIISILMVIVYGAINPNRQFKKAQNADRKYSMRVLEHAVSQYVIDGNTIGNVPYGISNAIPICQSSVEPNTCTDTLSGLDLSGLMINKKYIADIPIDPAQTSTTLTGYYIYREGGYYIVCSPIEDSNCG